MSTWPGSWPILDGSRAYQRGAAGGVGPRRPDGPGASLQTMSPISKALELKSVWLFSNCSGSELKKIRGSLDELTVPAGKVLVEEGRIGMEFFIIVSGTAAVTRDGKKVATLGPDAHFGELALLDRHPRSASVVSETEMDLLVLSQRQFNSLLESVPSIARKMLSAMSLRLREADALAYD